MVSDGLQRWYSHQFALSGGDEMAFDPVAIYGTPVSCTAPGPRLRSTRSGESASTPVFRRLRSLTES